MTSKALQEFWSNFGWEVAHVLTAKAVKQYFLTCLAIKWENCHLSFRCMGSGLSTSLCATWSSWWATAHLSWTGWCWNVSSGAWRNWAAASCQWPPWRCPRAMQTTTLTGCDLHLLTCLPSHPSSVPKNHHPGQTPHSCPKCCTAKQRGPKSRLQRLHETSWGLLSPFRDSEWDMFCTPLAVGHCYVCL